MEKRVSNTELFIEKSIEYHGDMFTFEKSVYVNGTTPIIITCKICGDFERTSRGHFKHKGCPNCNRKKSNETKNNPFKKDNFLKKSEKAHGDKFDYSKVVYVNCYTSVIIGCPIHGDMEMEPRHHYKNTGCYKCGRDQTGTKASKYKSLESLLFDFRATHGDKFDYSLINTDCTTWKGIDKIKIICPHHGEFEQIIRMHAQGNGCNQCRYFGYTRESYVNYCNNFGKDVSTLYILEFKNDCENFYKVGITARTIKERYRKEMERGGYDYSIVYSKDLTPSVAWDTEIQIKDNNIKYSYKPKNWFPGQTECFNLNLPIKEIIKNLENNFVVSD